jgi:N6-adenosine-specific RNA methylase IME4
VTFKVIVADPPWAFRDKLRMGKTKRGSLDIYQVLPASAIAELPVHKVAAPDALLALWCPAALLGDGFRVGAEWGFGRPSTVWTWVKRWPLRGRVASLIRSILKTSTKMPQAQREELELLLACGKLAWNQGHTFRAADEHCLIFRRGSLGRPARQFRNVWPGPPLKPHSKKPEALQDQLDAMYPDGERLELFARRLRPGWLCTGLEIDGRDAREFVVRLAAAGCSAP